MGIMGILAYGKGSMAMTIAAVLIATYFLVWVYGKSGAPLQKFAKVVAWIVFVIAAVGLVSMSYKCTYKWFKYDCYKGSCHKKYMKHRGKMKGGMKPRMERGMKYKIEIEEEEED
jgi:hypothetical protein